MWMSSHSESRGSKNHPLVATVRAARLFLEAGFCVTFSYLVHSQDKVTYTDILRHAGVSHITN